MQALSNRGAFGTISNHRFDLRTNNTVRLTVSPSGNVGIGTTAQASTLGVNGTVTVNTGNLDLDASTATTGNLLKDGVRFLHNFGTGNSFLGVAAGNFSLTGSNNVGVGGEALLGLTGGSANTALGRAALAQTTTGANNTAVGTSALLFNKTGSRNTAVGDEALFVNTGFDNTAVGEDTLRANTDGSANAAVGEDALLSNTSGRENTAVGEAALRLNTVGFTNTAVGRAALEDNVSGSANTAVGEGALRNTTGSGNIALGRTAGISQTTGNDSIYIGNPGVAGESFTTRIGGVSQGRAFIAGIAGTTTGVADAVAVLIDSAGQLGTASSSRRYKNDVRDMGDLRAGLQRLRPVTFRYKQAQAGGQRLEYGLIAEEVAEVYPGLVVYNEEGQPETVQYRKVNAMLLNEVQKQHRQIQALLARVARLEHRQTN